MVADRYNRLCTLNKINSAQNEGEGREVVGLGVIQFGVQGCLWVSVCVCVLCCVNQHPNIRFGENIIRTITTNKIHKVANADYPRKLLVGRFV